MKQCPKCGLVKPLAEWYGTRPEKQSRCAECKRSDARAAYHRHPEPARARSRERMRRRRAEQPEEMRAYIARWRADNPERVRARDAARRHDPARRAWQAAYWRAWKVANPERAREIARKGQLARRARLAAAFVEDVDPLVVLDQHNGVCHICEDPVDPSRFDVEHVIPLSRGGQHSYANTAPAHPRCNYVKGRRLPGELAA